MCQVPVQYLSGSIVSNLEARAKREGLVLTWGNALGGIRVVEHAKQAKLCSVDTCVCSPMHDVPVSALILPSSHSGRCEVCFAVLYLYGWR